MTGIRILAGHFASKPQANCFLPAKLLHSASSHEGSTYIMGIRTLVVFEDHVLPLA